MSNGFILVCRTVIDLCAIVILNDLLLWLVNTFAIEIDNIDDILSFHRWLNQKKNMTFDVTNWSSNASSQSNISTKILTQMGHQRTASVIIGAGIRHGFWMQRFRIWRGRDGLVLTVIPSFHFNFHEAHFQSEKTTSP